MTSWTAAHRASLSFTISLSLLKLLPFESVMPSNHLILCHPLFLLPSVFPSIRVFSNKLALCIRWLKYRGAYKSVLQITGLWVEKKLIWERLSYVFSCMHLYCRWGICLQYSQITTQRAPFKWNLGWPFREHFQGGSCMCEIEQVTRGGILGKVIKRMGLGQSESPHFFPVFGLCTYISWARRCLRTQPWESKVGLRPSGWSMFPSPIKASLTVVV